MEPVLSTANLSIGYKHARQPDHVVAPDVSVSLHPGELVCLLGPNGVGKSTLLRTLAAMQPALDGHVILLGDRVDRLSSRELARRLSVVLTGHINVGALSVYELVALGRYPHTNWTGRLSDHDEAIIRWAIERVGAKGLAARKVSELSDGQRQKILIARALAQEPAVMVLDEPTAFLDVPHRVHVMRILREIASSTGRAVLLSTHDLDLALRNADRVWLMSGLRPLQVGAPEDLILSGAFQQAFSGEGIEFDIHTGSFNVSAQTAQPITVSGEGTAAHWTQRALTRAGYTVVPPGENGAAPLRVEVIADDGIAPRWRVAGADSSEEYHSLHDLVSHLKHQAEG
jgi:iron complex transport system ATP-binding protein